MCQMPRTSRKTKNKSVTGVGPLQLRKEMRNTSRVKQQRVQEIMSGTDKLCRVGYNLIILSSSQRWTGGSQTQHNLSPNSHCQGSLRVSKAQRKMGSQETKFNSKVSSTDDTCYLIYRSLLLIITTVSHSPCQGTGYVGSTTRLSISTTSLVLSDYILLYIVCLYRSLSPTHVAASRAMCSSSPFIAVVAPRLSRTLFLVFLEVLGI